MRTAPEVYLNGVAAEGSNIGVVWSEPRAIGPALFLRTSTGGGASFGATRRLDLRPNQNPSVAVCQGRTWIASEVHYGEDQPGYWDITLQDHDQGGFGERPVTEPGVLLKSSEPAVACVGSRFIAVAWLEREEGDVWQARLRVLDPDAALAAGTPAGAAKRDVMLGLASTKASIALDATNGRVVVAWRRGADLVFQRFDVAPGSGVTLTPHPPRVLATEPRWTMALAAAGSRVVVAYSRANDLLTRHSTDGGASFGAPIKHLDNDPSCCDVASPNSLDLVGPRVLLEASDTYGDLEPFTEEWRFQSTNGGASFTRRKVGSAGQRHGAWAGSQSAPRIVEAWDDWTRYQGDNHIRFHRRS